MSAIQEKKTGKKKQTIFQSEGEARDTGNGKGKARRARNHQWGKHPPDSWGKGKKELNAGGENQFWAKGRKRKRPRLTLL